ncbi:MAG: tyrosine-type recombinase/integrase [Thermomicrobium sp.]|nr:tyrosine-type recombinase/integrase [Thermomicrobium sp.]
MATGVVRRRDGRYMGRVSVDGRRYTVYGASEAEARQKLQALLQRLGTGWRAPAPVTLDELVERWLTTQAPRWKPRTLADYRTLYQRHLAAALGPHKLARLVPDRLERALASVPGERTRWACYRLLHACLAKGVRWGYLGENPLDRVDPPPYQPRRKPLPSLGELRERLLRAQDDPWWPWVVLGVSCGLRPAEQAALTWADLDEETGRLRVERALVWLPGQVLVDTPKTARSRRTLSLPPLALVALERQRALVAERRARARDWVEHDLVFPGERGQPLQLSVVDRHVRRLVGVTPHQLRHLHASLLLEAQVPLPLVSARLGHATPHVTARIYAHALQDDRTVVERVHELLG